MGRGATRDPRPTLSRFWRKISKRSFRKKKIQKFQKFQILSATRDPELWIFQIITLNCDIIYLYSKIYFFKYVDYSYQQKCEEIMIKTGAQQDKLC